DVVLADVVVELRGDGSGLRDLLRHETLALEHVQKVGVASEVQLIRAFEPDASISHQACEHAVHDGRADLRLDVVADDGQTLVEEALLPVRLARNEDGDAVDETHAGGQRLLDIPLGRLFGADREIAHDDVRLGLLQDADYVGGLSGGFLHDVGEVLADTVVGHSALDLDAGPGHSGELHGVVGFCEDRLRQVEADLVLVDVKGRDELDVTYVVAAEVDM